MADQFALDRKFSHGWKRGSCRSVRFGFVIHIALAVRMEFQISGVVDDGKGDRLAFLV